MAVLTAWAERQRPKKSKLSGWQNLARENFPDGVRKSFLRQMRQKKRVNHFRDIYMNTFLQQLYTKSD